MVTEGRNWRRAPEEAPKTERRENMAAVFGFGLSPRKVINWRLRLKYHLMKNKRYRGVRYEVDVWLQRFSRAAIANVGRSFCIAGRPRWLAAVIGRVCTTEYKGRENRKIMRKCVCIHLVIR